MGLLPFHHYCHGLSASFDCVDHSMLLERLQSAFGLTDLVLDWVQSFLTDRTQQIACSGQLSPVQLVLFEVPQGSVLGPLLYVLYTAELVLVVDRYGLSLHHYADDTQVYISTPAGDAEAAVRRLTVCLVCLLYTSPSPRDRTRSRMPSSA